MFTYEGGTPRRMPRTCFAYDADVPLGNRGAARAPVPGLRRMPQMCFGYPGDMPPGDRGAAQAPVPGLRQMPNTCFGTDLARECA